MAKDGNTTGITCVTASGTGAEVATQADLAELRGTIKGPADSPFENGIFRVEIKSQTTIRSAPQNEVYNEDLAPKCIVANGSYLLGYTKGPMVACTNAKDGPAVVDSVAHSAGTHRSAGCPGGQHVFDLPQCL